MATYRTFKNSSLTSSKNSENICLRVSSCSNCQQIFAVRDPLHPRGAKCPLILHCGHSACEYCIRTSIQTTHKVTCGICNQTSTTEEANRDFKLDFPLNLYLLGTFAARNVTLNPEDSKINFFPAAGISCNKKFPGGIQKDVKTETCAECMKKGADWKCRQCEVLYCNQCFNRIHSTARALSKHEKFAIDEIVKKVIVAKQNCGTHPAQTIEFHCKDCNQMVCAHCVICLHQGHSVITKRQKNEEGLKDLNEAKEKAVEMLKRLIHTQKKLEGITLPSTSNMKMTPVELEVVKHFVYLHGALQLLEDSILKKLRSVKNESTHMFESIESELYSQIQNIHLLLQEASIIEEPSSLDKIEVDTITNKLIAVQDIPCHLMVIDGDSAEPYVSFNVDESFVDQVENHCELRVQSGCSYSLVKTEELPPDMAVDPVDDIELDYIKESSRASSLSAVSDLTGSSLDITSCKQKKLTNRRNDVHTTKLSKGNSDIVTVCHIRDPSTFYVHRVADTMNIENLSKQLAKHVVSYNKPPEEVLQNGLYIVQYNLDKKWYRARVKEILSLHIDGKEHCEILYIDYGNTEIVPSTKLRCIPPRCASTPAMALQCTLFGINPVGGVWSKEAVKTFAVMVDGSRVKMVVMDYVVDMYHVDLCQIHGENHDSDVPLSVRDALVFLEHACFLDNTKHQTNTAHKTVNYHFEPIDKILILQVLVSHIESPHSFYVQRLGQHANYLKTLMNDMNASYSNSHNKGLIYTPQVGMPCAAQYAVDKKWYRARIIDLPGNKMIQVFYVDYGNTEVIPWNRLRKLHPRFMRLPMQGIYCSLSDVEPIQPPWTAAARDFFMKVTGKKMLQLFVDEIHQRQLKVTILESSHLTKVDVCINALLVQEGFATSVGPSSRLVEYHKCDSVAIASPDSRSMASFKKKPIILNLGTLQEVKAVKAYKMTENDTPIIEDPFRLEVKVLNCLSPSHIYVTLINQEEQIKNLMCELQEHYATCTSHVDSWEVNMKCCVFSIQHKEWYRAIIVELLPLKEAKVFLKDFAEVEIVPISNLQLLDPKFLSIRDGAIKCHLAEVRAAGDKPDWPGLACEYLNEQIARFPSIYITKKGDIENFSLPIELWVKEIKQGGPLEPSVEEWKVLNKQLVDQGLAIPIRRDTEVQSITSSELLKELDVQSYEENKNSIADWLKQSAQAESVKTESSDIALDTNCEDIYEDIDDETEAVADAISQVSISEWLPPEPLTKIEFTGIPSYVDDEGYIYLYDADKKNTLDLIGNALLSRFKNSEPKPSDLYWFPNQLCIAQYHHDQKWYRGKVMEVDEDRKVKVMFVDYGNVEDCKASEMRKNTYMSQLPIQCHKCQLYGIGPASEDGKWPTSTLDFIHTTVVEKVCKVILKEEWKPNQPPMISLIAPGNIDIAEILVQMQFAIYTDNDQNKILDSDIGTSEESVIIEDEDITEVEENCKETSDNLPTSEETEPNTNTLSDAVSNIRWCDLVEEEERLEMQKTAAKNHERVEAHYESLKLPDCDSITVEVTAILSSTEVVIHPCKEEGSELMKLKEEFEKLTEDIQDEAEFQPMIKKPFIGQPCCAQYSADELWYRGVIVAIDQEDLKVKIQYVDYGNAEFKPIDKIYELKPQWLSVPMQGLRTKLWNIKRPEKWKPDILFSKLAECLFQPPLVAKIKEREPVLQVELLTNEDCTLAYQSMLDEGLLLLE